MENEKKEIDLLEALKSFGSWLYSVGLKCSKGLGWMLRFMYQQKYIILLFAIAGVCFGLYRAKDKIYMAEVDLKLKSHDAFFYKNLLDPMHKQCEYLDFTSISKQLNISLEDAQKITDIKSFYYIDVLCDDTPDKIDYDNSFNPMDTNNVITKDMLRLVVCCKDTSFFNPLKQSFLEYFSKNEQIMKENELKQSQLGEKIKAVENEIIMLDSLRKKEYFHKKNDLSVNMDKALFVSEKETKLYHNDILSLENYRQSYIWEQKIYDNCAYFASDFKVNPRPVNYWVKFIIKYGLIFTGVGFIVALLWVYRKRILDYLNQEI
ncbi:MAG: hypothetical protein U0L67_04620 [Paludibacteraceae bacterium]|jgi:hypothetical protein|nr:hypothetical protein [Paludibacteraceae bacterium]